MLRTPVFRVFSELLAIMEWFSNASFKPWTYFFSEETNHVQKPRPIHA